MTVISVAAHRAGGVTGKKVLIHADGASGTHALSPVFDRSQGVALGRVHLDRRGSQNSQRNTPDMRIPALDSSGDIRDGT